MITSSFKRNRAGHIVSFEVSGHADAGPYGRDIVCAAVSALTINTVNGIEALAGFIPVVEVNQSQGGYLYAEIISNPTQEQLNIAQILLENLLLGLQNIQQEHHDHILVKTII